MSSARRMTVVGLIGLALAVSVSVNASAEPAAAEVVVRKTVDDAFVVLRDKSLSGKERRGQRIAALREIADRAFDWSEMARGSLGVIWRSLDGAHRARFVEVFKDVLAARYMEEIDRFEGTERISVDGSTLEADQTVVRTTLVTASRERVAIKVGERFMLVQADEIVYASVIDEGITVVTNQHAGTSNFRTLEELHERLDPSLFWRVHRSHLVNINKIKEIVPWFSRNYILRMKDEKATEIPVSRTQTKRLREYLKI